MIKGKPITGLNKLLISTLFLACVSILISPLKGNGQTQTETGLPFITNYSPKTYKAYPQNWSIAEDERGIMYFGNQNLILEYDGVRWNKIKLTNSVVRSMATHKDGLIYYGGFGDLGYLDFDSLGQKKTFSLLDLVPTANRNFLDIWTTYSTESGIYFQAREYLFRLNDAKPGTNEKRTIKVWTPKTKFMYSFYLDNNFYVHQQGLGLYKMVNDSLVLIPGSEFLGKERMQVMLPYKTESNEKEYLIGMFYSGLYLFNGTTFQPFATKADPIIKSGSLLYKGLLLKNGNYVLSTTGKGLVIIDAQGNLLQRLNREVGLQDESVYANYQDKKGTLWLGLDNGISRVETSSPTTQFTLQSGINTGVLTINRFEGNLYIGTTNGLLSYNNKKSFFEPVPGIPQNQIFTLFPDGKQLLVPGDGLFAVRDKKTSTLKESVSADLTLSALYKSTTHPDILFGGGTFGVAVFTRPSGNTGTKESLSWQFKGYIQGITDQIWTFAENKDGTIWAGTQAGSAYKIILAFNDKGDFDLTKTIFEKYGEKNGFKDGTGQVYNIKGKNYFFADSSLYTFDDKQKRFIADSTFGNFKNGGGKVEYDMVEDNQGRVWIRFGKDTRLAIPKPEGGYRFDDSQLSTIKELTIQKIYPESNGIVWVCTTDGLIRYDENLEKNVEQSYKTVIRFASAGKNILSTVISPGSKPVSVSYKNNTLRFEYAAPFFEQEDRTQYQTWLEGFETDWSDFGFNYYKEYTNIPTGDYHFHVRAKNVFQKISEEAVYHFSIYPPWYATWWAYTLYAIAAVLLIYSIIRWRTRQLHEKHRELEKIVNERTSQLSHRVEELAVINSVQDGLVREMNMQGIYELVGEKIREIFDAQVIDIVTYDSKTNLLEDRYAYEKGDRTLVGTFEPKGFRKHVIDTGQLLLINKDLDKKSLEFNAKVIHGELPKSAVFVPMISGGKVTGMISLQNLDKENVFSESSVSLLTTLSNSMSVALESARRFDETTRLLKETEQRNAELAVINSVQDGLVREMDMQGIYELVGEKIREIFDAQVIDIVTYDKKTNLIEDRYAYEKGDRSLLAPREPKGFRKHVIDTGIMLMHNENIEQAMRDFDNPILIGETPKSQVYVPMKASGEVNGIISLQNIDHEHAFSDSDVRLINTLANTMSIALESARLFDETKRLLKETEQRNAELAVINSVQDGLVREMDMQGIYELVGEKIRNIFDAQVIDIVMYDRKTKMIEDRYSYEKGDRTLLGPRKPFGFRKHVIDNKTEIVVNKDLEKLSVEYNSPVIQGETPKSMVMVPMIAGVHVTGIISLQNIDHEDAFSDSDVRLVNTLANTMSIALESARLFDETKRLLKETKQRNAELAVINSVQDGLVREMDMQGIYELVGEKIREIFDAQVIDIVTYDKKTNQVEDRYSYEKGDRSLLGAREPKGFRKHVIETGDMLLHNDNVEKAMREFGNEILIGEVPKSQVYVPMKTGSEVNGIISLQNIDHENAFSDSDIRLITTLSNTMSIALGSARLFDETKRLLKETEQRTAELAVINSVQEGLAKELDIQGIYDLVGDRIRNLFDAQVVGIATLDIEAETELFKYVFEKGTRYYPEARSYDKLRQHLIKTRQKILINNDFIEAYNKFGMKAVSGTELPKSALYVPLIIGEKITSYVTLQNIDRENAFSESDVRLLETLANSMSVALENARLFDETTRLLKETEQRTAELAVINSVQDGLAKELDIQGIYDLVGERIIKVFNAPNLVIRTFDHETGEENWRYAVEKGERQYIEPKPFVWHSKQLIQTQKPIQINENYLETSKKFGGTGVFVGQPTKSGIFVPMIVGGIVKGSVSLQNVDKEFAYTEADLRLLTTITNSMSVALENARLFDETSRLLKETEQRTAELSVINSVQDGLARELDISGIYELVGEKIREIFNAQVIDIVAYDKTTNLIADCYTYEKGDKTLLGPRPLKGFRKHVIETAKPLLINKDVYQERTKYDQTVITGKGAKSIVLVPMIAGGEVTGVISLQNLDQENVFSESDVKLLTTLSNSMSVALESARLFDETTRLLKETEQRTAELAVINSVQEGLAKELDMQGIYTLVGDRLCELFPDTQTLVIRTFDHETGFEHWKYAKEKGVRQNVEPRPLNWNSKQLILTKKPLDIKENYVEISKKHGGTGVTAGQPPKSAVFVPMVVGDLVRGSVSLQNVDKENAFTDSDLRLLTTITNSMSVALENARLFDETNRLLKETEMRQQELATINSVQEGLVREMNTKAIYTLVGNRICELFDTQTLIIRTFDYETGLEHYHYAIEKGSHLNIDPRPFIWANKQLIETKHSLLINKNYLETARKFGGTGVGKGLPPKSALFVPMIVGDVVKGSVSLQNVDREDAFDEADLRLLTTLTNSMSVALENARLFDETTLLLAESKQRATELSTVNSISKALASQLDPDDLIKMVGDQLQNLFKANIIYLALLDKKTNIIEFPYQYGDNMAPLKLGEGLTSKIIMTGEPILINKDLSKQRTQMGIQLVGLESASYLGVPIPVGEENIGVLSVQSTEHENRFNENDLRLLSTIGSSVGVALRNATLFEDVQQAKMEAEAAGKAAEKANDAKSAFLSTVSHELRTPLTSVLGFAKIIKKRLEERIFPLVDKSDSKIEKAVNQVSENLHVVISEGTRLTHLINDVLDLAKIEAGKMEFAQENVSMLDVAERALAATTSLFEQKDLKLIKKIDTDLPDVIGDKDKLIQVMINLISNSVKFTDKGSITCSVHLVKNEIIASIRDTGIGIAMDDYGAVFEQFKQVGGDTLTDKPKGTGLGLPICKEIVEHLGGRIWLESEVGKGSVFSFALPVTKAAVAERPIHLNDLVKQLKEQVASSKLNITGLASTILIVDDDDSIRSLLHQELGDAGYLIIEAKNGKEALDCVRKQRPDLIILDIMMPEMNGFDVAAVLKNDPNTMDIPIIVLSVVQDKARGFRIGVDRYLTKPIDTGLLFSEVGSLLEQGNSRKKVLIVDEDTDAVRTLSDVLKAKGYEVSESKEKELVSTAIASLPDIIIINSLLSGKQDIVQTLRFEKGLENVLFVVYQ